MILLLFFRIENKQKSCQQILLSTKKGSHSKNTTLVEIVIPASLGPPEYAEDLIPASENDPLRLPGK